MLFPSTVHVAHALRKLRVDPVEHLRRRVEPMRLLAMAARHQREQERLAFTMAANFEHHGWRDQFGHLMRASPGASQDPEARCPPIGTPQFRANDRAHLRKEIARHQRRLERLGSWWMSMSRRGMT